MSRRPDPRRLAGNALGVPRRPCAGHGDRGGGRRDADRCPQANRRPTPGSRTPRSARGGICWEPPCSVRMRSGSCASRRRATPRATTAPRSSRVSRSRSASWMSCPGLGPLGAALLVANAAAFGALLLLARADAVRARRRRGTPRRAVHCAVPDGVLPVRPLQRVAVPAAVDRARSGSRAETDGVWAALAGAVAAATRSVGSCSSSRSGWRRSPSTGGSPSRSCPGSSPPRRWRSGPCSTPGGGSGATRPLGAARRPASVATRRRPPAARDGDRRGLSSPGATRPGGCSTCSSWRSPSAGIVLAARRIPLTYTVYAAASVLLPLLLPLASRPLLSMPRFMVVVFPASWGWALAAARRRPPETATLVVFAAGFALLAFLFMNWQPIF